MVVPVVPTVGKQVFLLVVTAIPTVMRCMTPAVTKVKKAAVGGKKSPAGAGTKTAAWEKPLPGPPQGAGVHFRCVLGGWVVLPPFGEGWGGALGLGRGFSVGLSLNTIIPASTWTDGNDLWVNYEKCIDAAMLNSISGGCSIHWNECRSTLSKLRCYHHIYKYRVHYQI